MFESIVIMAFSTVTANDRFVGPQDRSRLLMASRRALELATGERFWAGAYELEIALLGASRV